MKILRTSLAVAAILSGAWRTAGAQGAGGRGQPVGGISCDAMEGTRIHIHQHLTILDHGKPVAVPANVGRPGDRPCLYWVHTHTPDGVIHIEAPGFRAFTLGDFFAIWGEQLNRTQAASAQAAMGQTLRVSVNGSRFTCDPLTIPLAVHTDIVIEAGPPFPKPPKFTAWGTL